MRTLVIRFTTFILMVFLLNSCGGQGNELLESGSLGVAIDVVSGDNQNTDPSTIIDDPVVVVVRDAVGTPIPFMNIEVVEITSTDSEVVSTTFVTDGEGKVELRVRSSSVYGEEAQYRVSIAGTSDFTTFAVLNGKGGIYRYEVTTSEGDTLIAGEDFKFIINALDDQNNIVEELGTADKPVNIAMYWEFNHERSWGGFKAKLPPQLQAFECQFVEGVCTSTLDYHFTDSARPTYVSVGDGDGGAVDVFQKPFTVNSNVEAGFYLAQSAGGPNYVYNGLTELWDNLGAETWYRSPEGDPYSADDPAVRLYAVTIDKAGNYVRDANAADAVVYEGLKEDDNTAYDRMADYMTPAADGTYVDFDPTLMMYESYSGAIRVTGNVFNGFKSGIVEVNPGTPAVLQFASDNNFVETAAESFGISISIYDAHGNLQVSTPTQPGLNGSLKLDYAVYDYKTGLGAAINTYWTHGGFNFNTLPRHEDTGTNIGMTVLEGIVPSSTLRRTFMDASDVAPYIDFQVNMDDNPGTFEDESFSLSGTTPTFTVNVNVPYRYNVYRDDGDPATDPRMCQSDSGDARVAILECPAMNLPTGTPATDYYIVMEDQGGNALVNNAGNWELSNANGDPVPYTGLLRCANTSCQPNVNISPSGYQSLSHFTSDYDFFGYVRVDSNDPNHDGVRGFGFNVQSGQLDHYKVVVVDNEGAGTSNVLATDNSFSLQITSHDQYDNQIYDTGARNFTMNITSGGPIEDAPNASTTANFDDFSVTFDNDAKISGLRLPNSDKNSTIVLTIEDENGILSEEFSINVLPGAENEIRIHSAADPTVGNTYVNELIAINTDQTLNMYAMSHDAMGNFRQLINASWTAFDGLENQVEPLASGANYEAVLDPHTTGTGGKIRASYNGRSAETGIVTVEPGAFFSIVVSDHSVTAGEAQEISVELVDSEENVLTNFTGNKNLVISVLDNSLTRKNFDHDKPANGSYNFVNGVLSPAHNITLYKNVETPRIRYETEGKVGTSNPWTVSNNTPDHIYINSSASTMDAGTNLYTTYYLCDVYGNRIYSGGYENTDVSITYDTSLNGQVFNDVSAEITAGIGTDTVTGTFSNGWVRANLSATQAGVIRPVATTPSFGPLPGGNEYAETVTVLPLSTVDHIDFAAGFSPPSTHTASTGSNKMAFKVQLLDVYNNVITQNSSDEIRLSVASVDSGSATSLLGDVDLGVTSGESYFVDIAYPRAQQITLEAGHFASGIPSGATVQAVIDIVPGLPIQSIMILPGETLVEGVLSIGLAKTGSPTTQTAGVDFNVDIYSVDEAFNVVDTYSSGSNVLSISGDNNFTVSPASAVFTNGHVQATANAKLAGGAQIIQNACNLYTCSTSSPIVMNPGDADQLVLILPGQTIKAGSISRGEAVQGVPADQVAGGNFTVTVYATDQYYNTRTSDNTSVVDLSYPGDPQAVHAGGSSKTLSSGIAYFDVTYYLAQTGTVVSSALVSGDTFTPSNSNSFNVTVGGSTAYTLAYSPTYQTFNPGQADINDVITGTIPDLMAGELFDVKFIAVDSYGNKRTTENAAVSIVYSDTNTNVPAATNFSSGEILYQNQRFITKGTGHYFAVNSSFTDRNSSSFNVINNNSRQVITVLQGESLSQGQFSLANAITGTPDSVLAGTAGYTVDAYLVDDYYNVIEEDGLSVSISTSDPTDTDPSAQTLVSGHRQFTMTNYQAGTQNVSPVSAETNISSNDYIITANPATQTVVLMPGQVLVGGYSTHGAAVTGPVSSQMAGFSYVAKVRAVDQYFNIDPNFNGSFAIAGYGTDDNIPSGLSFSSGVNDVTITNYRAGSQSLSVTSTLTDLAAASFIVQEDTINAPKLIVKLEGETLNEGRLAFANVMTGSQAEKDANEEFVIDVFCTDQYFNVIDAHDGSTITISSPTDPWMVNTVASVNSDQLSLGKASFKVYGRRARTNNLLPATGDISGVIPVTSNDYWIKWLDPANFAVMLPGETLSQGAPTYAQAFPNTANNQKVSTGTTDNGFLAKGLILDKYFNIIGSRAGSPDGNLSWTYTLSSSADPHDNEGAYSVSTFVNGEASIEVDHVRAGTGFSLTPGLSGHSFTGDCSDATGNCNNIYNSKTYDVDNEVAVKSAVLFSTQSLSDPGNPTLSSAIGGSVPSNLKAADSFTVKVIALDENNNLVDEASNAVSVSTSDPTDIEPSASSFSSGEATFTIDPVTATSGLTISPSTALATDVDSDSYTVDHNTLDRLLVVMPNQTFNPGQLSQGNALVNGISTQTAGTSFTAEVYGVDSRFNVVDDSADLVSISLADTNAPGVASQNLSAGYASFSVVNHTASAAPLTHTLTASTGAATDFTTSVYSVLSETAKQAIVVLPGQTHVYGVSSLANAVTGTPTDQTSAQDFTVQVRAVDEYFNLVPSWNGSVSISTADPLDTEPVTPSSFSSGVASFTVNNIRPTTSGVTHNITPAAVSLNAPATNHTSSDYTVIAAAPTQLVVLMPGETLVEGSGSLAGAKSGSATDQNTDSDYSVQVYAVDDYFNISTAYNTGTVNITTGSDPTDSNPAAGTFSSGLASFTVSSVTAVNSAQITVSNGEGLINNHGSLYNILPGAANQWVVKLPGETFSQGQTSLGSAIGGSPSAQQSAEAFDVEVYLTDAEFNVVDNDSQTISLSTSDTADSDPSSTTLTDGTATISVTNVTVGSGHTITPSGGSYSANASSSYVVSAGTPVAIIARLPGQTHNQPAVNLGAAITGAETVDNVDNDFSVELIAVDANFNKVSTYTSAASSVTVSTPNDSKDTEPSSGQFVNGSVTFTISPVVAGATNVVNVSNTLSLANNNSSNYGVDPGASTHLLVELPGESFNPGNTSISGVITGSASAQVAGTSFTADVHLVDAEFNLVDDDTSTVSLSSNDANDTDPVDVTLSNGSASFTVTNHTAGTGHLLSPSLSGKIPHNSNTYTVNPGAASKLLVALPSQTHNPGVSSGQISGAAPTQVSGTPFTVTVYATDAFHNLITSDSSSVISIASSDSNDVEPSNETLASGVASFDIDPVASGSGFTVTASRVSGSVYSDGTSDSYTVDPGAPTQIIVRLPGQTHNQPAANLAAAITGAETINNVDSDFTVEVIAVDAQFNKVSTYNPGSGVITVSTPNDSVDTEPASNNFSNGSVSFTVSPVQAGATNQINVTNNLGLVNNNSSNYGIDPGASTQLLVEMPGQSFNPGQTSLANAISGSVTDQVAGTGFSAKVHLVDAEFNLVDDDASVVSLASNDPYDTEPSDITLTDGSADFTVVNQYAGTSHVLTPGLSGKTINASTSYNVNAGAAAKMVVLLPGQSITAGPSSETIAQAAPDQVSGTSFTVTVVATDAYYNTVSTDSSSVIALTTSDSADSHPSNETLVNGVATFSVNPVTSGTNFNVSASVVSGASYGTDTSQNYDVDPGSLAHILALLPGDTLNSPAASAAAAVTNAGYSPTAGSSFDITLKAVDSNFNLISTYNSSAYIRWTLSGATNAADAPNESPSVPANASRTFSSGSVTISNAATLYNADDSSASIQAEYCSDGAACTSIVSTHSTGSMAVSAAALDYIKVLDAASNAGSVFPSQDESTATTSIAMYAAGYDNYGNYLGDQSATWQATRTVAGDIDSALSSTSGSNITFDPSTAGVGSATVTATASAKSDSTGVFNILDQGASQFDVELASVGDKTSGTGFAVTITARKPDNSVATDYSGSKTITWSNSASNGDTTCTAGPHAPVEASTTLSFSNGVATTATSFVMKKAESGVTITATSASNGALTDSTSAFNVVAGSENCNLLRTAAANGGSLLSDQTLSFDGTFNAYLASYDQYGNYIEDKSTSWTGTGIASFVSETTSAFDFTAHQQGTGTISAGGESINITVNSNGSGTLWTNSSSDHDGKTLLGSTNAQIVRVWDVSSDAVNAWRTSGTQSWYSEASSATRGVKQEFPEKALLVATASGIDVIDMQENRLFLRFDYSSGYALNSDMGSIQDIEALNGKMIVSIGNGSSNALLVIVDFANDNIYHITNSSAQILSGGVVNRNISGSWGANGTYSNLANTSLGKIDVARVSGSDYLAYATASGVYVTSLSGGSVYGDSSGDMDDVALDSSGKLYYYENGVGLNRADLSLPLSASFSASRTYSGASSAKILEMNVDSIAIAEGESSADAGQNRVVIAGSRGIASVDEHSTAASSDASSYARQGSGNTAFDNYLNFDSASFTAADKTSRPTTAFTIEFFFQPSELLNTADSDMVLFQKGDGSAEEDYGIRFNGTTGNIEFVATHDNTGLAEVSVASSASSWNQGQWYHVAAVLDAGVMKLWIDGTYQGSTAILSTGWTGNTNAPEWAASASSSYFKGALDEFRLTSDARYTGTASISVPSAEFLSDGTTVYLYHFDETNGTTVTDSSSSAANGTTTGDAVFVKTWASGSTQAVTSVKAVGSGSSSRMTFVSNGSFYQWNPSSNTVDESIIESGIKDAELYYYNSSTDSHKAFVGTSGLRIISE